VWAAIKFDVRIFGRDADTDAIKIHATSGKQ
jgi:hypothetical protein